jgi:hypothetical protein
MKVYLLGSRINSARGKTSNLTDFEAKSSEY